MKQKTTSNGASSRGAPRADDDRGPEETEGNPQVAGIMYIQRRYTY